MPRRYEKTWNGAHAGEHAGVQLVDAIPGCGDLDRVDDHALLQEILEPRNSIAMMQPAVHGLRSDDPTADLGCDRVAPAISAATSSGGPSVSTNKQTLAGICGAGERATSLDLVVEAEDGGPPPCAHDPA